MDIRIFNELTLFVSIHQSWNSEGWRGLKFPDFFRVEDLEGLHSLIEYERIHASQRNFSEGEGYLHGVTDDITQLAL